MLREAYPTAGGSGYLFVLRDGTHCITSYYSYLANEWCVRARQDDPSMADEAIIMRPPFENHRLKDPITALCIIHQLVTSRGNTTAT